MRPLAVIGIVGGSTLVVGIFLGVLISGVFTFAQTGGVNLPFQLEHNDIAYNVMCRSAGQTCSLGHAFTTIASWAPYSVNLRDIGEFAKGDQYPQSIWVFKLEGKVEVVMRITGPNSQDGYILEFARLTSQDVQIIGHDNQFQWQKASWEGYTYFTIRLGG